MGHLINPISNRLALNSFWNSNWASNNNSNYVHVFKQDYLLFQFLDWFIKKSKFGRFNIIISHYKIYRLNNKVYINFYYYNAGLEEKTYHHQIKSLITLLEKKNKSYNYNSNNSVESLTLLNNTSLNISKDKLKSLYIYIIKSAVSNLYWYTINRSLNFYLTKLNSQNDHYYFNIFGLDFLNITTDIISTYISLKLQQKYSLNWVLRPILKDLSLKIKSKMFLGYKIVCSGRFTRKQIATYMWMKEGSLQLNNFSSLVKYSQSTVKLKYGLCGVKVWLNYGYNDSNLFKRNLFLIYPQYTPFKYSIELDTKSLIFHINYWFFVYIRMCGLKSKFYTFYRNYVDIKMHMLLEHVYRDVFKGEWLNGFDVNSLDNNKLKVTPVKRITSFRR